jgi:hypothetical protein
MYFSRSVRTHWLKACATALKSVRLTPQDVYKSPPC